MSRASRLFGAAVLSGTVAAGTASLAQQSVIEHCRNTSSAADRIACLEAAILARDTDEQPIAAPAPPAEEATAAAKSRARQPARRDSHGTADSGGEEAARNEATGIGEKQVEARDRSRADIEADLESAESLRVAEYEEIPWRRLQVTLDNGQVWRQIEGDRQHIRVDLDRNQTVDIEESGLGGYKLKLNEMERTIRVRRVK